MVTKYAKAWRRVSGLSCLWLTLGLFLTPGLHGQEAQQLTQSGFNSALEIALSENDEKELDHLIRTYRLFVKPFTNNLLSESIQLELQGDKSAATRSKLNAGRCASFFEAIHGEKNLSIGVKYLQNWDPEQKQLKLTADELYSLGTRYRLQKESDSALIYLNRALGLYRTISDERGEGEVLGGIGATYFDLAEYDKALTFYQEALKKRIDVDDRQLTGATLNSLGSVNLQFTGDYLKAINYYDRAETLREEIGDLAGLNTTRYYKAYAFMLLAEELSQSARYPEALEQLRKALELYRMISVKEREGEALSQMGLIYYRTGDYNRAAEILTEAAGIMKEENNESGLAGVYNHFGLVLQDAGRSERALGYYNESLKIYEALEDVADMLPVINNLGTLYYHMKDYGKAEELYQKGLKLSRESGSKDLEVNFLLNLANNYTSTGRLDEAMLNYRAAHVIAEEEENPDLLWRITVSMAENYEKRGDLGNAIAYNDTALSIIEGIRSNLQDNDLKAFYIARERYVFEDIVTLLASLHFTDPGEGYDNLAFRYAENCKSRVLLDLLDESHTRENEGIQIKDNPEGMAADVISLTDVQRMLPGKDCVVLEYSVGDSASIMWVISQSGCATFQLPGRKMLQEQIETIRFALTDPSQADPQFFSKTASQLYRELISPAEPFLTRKSTLVIIPDDILNYLPFEVLLTTDSESLTGENSFSNLPFLVKRYPVSYVQSASILNTLLKTSENKQGNRHQSPGLVAFGDPVTEDYTRLEFSGREVETITSLFREGSAEIYIGKQATEENIKHNDKISDADYLHFATHGIIDETNPDLSALVLSNAANSEEDGLLEAKEIFNLDINSRLVVLSACQTGLGKMIRGEGMVGLTRAFMYAGTPSVLVSLWSVSDNSTSILMGEFYKNLIRRKLYKTEALRRAQISMLKNPQLAHPFYWAPFILIGDWR